MNLSKNLTLAEVTKSQTAKRNGIDNNPSKEEIANLKLVAEKIFQPVREHFKVPISVTSGYRSKKLNKLIGGAKNSEHVEGRALDLDADVFGGVTNKEIFDFIKTNLEFNQLIWEFGDDNNPDWVHVSYREGENKKRVLRAVKVKGDTLYKVII
jgi:zinc D-Ala-D-Ala carboxypeptidase